MKKNKIFWKTCVLGLLVCCLNSKPVVAQRMLTLEETLRITEEHSPSLRDTRIALEKSKLSVDIQKSNLKARFKLNVSPFSFSKSNDFYRQTGEYIYTENISSMGNFSIDQPLAFSDGLLSFNSRMSWIDPQTSPATYNTSLNLSYSQPIFRTYNETKRNLEEVELNYERARLEYAIQVVRNEYVTTQRYLQLYKSQTDLQLSKEKHAVDLENYEITKMKVEADILPRADLLQAEVNLLSSESSLRQSILSFEDAKDEFKIEVGIPLEEDFMLMAELSSDSIEVDMQEAITYALDQRMEIRQQQINLDDTYFNLIQTRNQDKFQGDVTLSVGFTGNNQEFAKMFENPNNNQNIGITLSIPIWDWGVRKKRIKQAEIDIKQAELHFEEYKRDIVVSIRKICRGLPILRDQVLIAKKNIDFAKQSYEINLERYKSGQISSMDLKQHQDQWEAEKRNYTNALINYRLEVLNLKVSTLWDFQLKKSILPTELLQNIK